MAVPTGRHGPSPDVEADQQRDRLFVATVELVAKRGYRETTVDRIVKAANVDPVAFTQLYADKEECFLAAFDRIVEETVETVVAAAEGAEGWPEEMATGISCLLDLVAADPRRARIAVVEAQAAGPRALARYGAAVDRAMPKLREGRQFSQEAAALSGALEEAILGGVLWIVHQCLVNGQLGEIEALLEDLIQLALAPYLGDEAAKHLAAATPRDRARRT